jgi:hypothetical protein
MEAVKRQVIENARNDAAVLRCGHNFPLAECPYRYCAGRALLLAAQTVDRQIMGGHPVGHDAVVALRFALRLAGIEPAPERSAKLRTHPADRYFRTYTGKHVHALSPSPEEIDIEDVAHSLSQTCRFLGHTDGFYSVAQHSVLVSDLVPREDALWGLLHDASEAYLCDLPAPIKGDPEMSFYGIAEDRLMLAICKRFGLRPEMPRSVIAADKLALATEFRDVTTVDDPDWIVAECGTKPIPDYTIFPWPSLVAEDRFLRRFWELAE